MIAIREKRWGWQMDEGAATPDITADTHAPAEEQEAGPQGGTTVTPSLLRAGFTPVDNRALDDAMAALSGAAWKCLCYLMRRTWGYHQDGAQLSIAQIASGSVRQDGTPLDRGTGLSRRAVVDALRELEGRHLIASDASERARTQVRTYTILPVICWEVGEASPSSPDAEPSTTDPADDTPTSAEIALVHPTSAKSSPVHRTKLVQKLHKPSAEIALVEGQTSAKIAHLLKKGEKDNSKDNQSGDAAASRSGVVISPSPTASSPPVSRPAVEIPPTAPPAIPTYGDGCDELRLAHYLRAHILKTLPTARVPLATTAGMQKWAHVFHLILTRDHKNVSAVRRLIEFAHTDSFWRANILSPGSLRDKWDTLEVKRLARDEPRAVSPSRYAPREPPPPVPAASLSPWDDD